MQLLIVWFAKQQCYAVYACAGLGDEYAWWSAWEADVADGLVDGAAAAGGGSSRQNQAASATAADEAQLAALDMQVWLGLVRRGGWGRVQAWTGLSGDKAWDVTMLAPTCFWVELEPVCVCHAAKVLVLGPGMCTSM